MAFVILCTAAGEQVCVRIRCWEQGREAEMRGGSGRIKNDRGLMTLENA